MALRDLFEGEYRGQRLYIFTTFGHLYTGIVEEVVDDTVRILGPDGTTRILVQLSDISGFRGYDSPAEDT